LPPPGCSPRRTPRRCPATLPGKMPEQRRRRIRLEKEAYADSGRVFSVTVSTAPKAPIFSDVAFGLECVQPLRELRDSLGNPVYAYCFMPDHVHLLLGVSHASPLGKIVGAWKSRCYQLRRRRGHSTRFWQRSFYDHGLRTDEDLNAAALYILHNPVRAGMVQDFHDYPLCGSLEFKL
jgi:putative transposase